MAPGQGKSASMGWTPSWGPTIAAPLSTWNATPFFLPKVGSPCRSGTAFYAREQSHRYIPALGEMKTPGAMLNAAAHLPRIQNMNSAGSNGAPRPEPKTCKNPASRPDRAASYDGLRPVCAAAKANRIRDCGWCLITRSRTTKVTASNVIRGRDIGVTADVDPPRPAGRSRTRRSPLRGRGRSGPAVNCSVDEMQASSGSGCGVVDGRIVENLPCRHAARNMAKTDAMRPAKLE